MRKYYRFVDGLRKFIKAKMTPQEALALSQSVLKKRIAAREENFLNLARTSIFGYPKSPYLRLLQPLGIRFSDVKSWVERDGIESALNTLQHEGICFSVDEFKGKVPVVRNGASFRCHESMFDNPFLSGAYEVRSGATRSAGTRIRIDFDYLHQRSLYDAFLLNAHGCLTAPIANWFPTFPGAPGINSSLRFAHIGNTARKWFSQVSTDSMRVNWEKRWGTKLIFAVTSLYGSPLAQPEYVELKQAIKIARWAHEVLQTNPACVVYTFAASAVRIAIAAAENNLNLAGAKFFVTGEPLTPHKKREIEASGGSAVPVYGISEAGVIAAGCGQPHTTSDHCHLYKDTTAIVTRKTRVPHLDRCLDEYLFTTLLYESPKLLLNVGMGDYGDVVEDSCNCDFARLGFNVSLYNIRSFEKLTGEGVTFVDTDLIRILEKHLPEHFGGKSMDYQLVESENGHGFTQLYLRVSPRLGTLNEEEVLRRFLSLLRNAEDSPESWAQAGSEMWKQSGIVQIRRDDPIPTASGKVLPFHLLKAATYADSPVPAHSEVQ